MSAAVCMTPSLDSHRHFSRDANAASNPLPLIPRRSHSRASSNPSPATPPRPTTLFVVQPPTPSLGSDHSPPPNTKVNAPVSKTPSGESTAPVQHRRSPSPPKADSDTPKIHAPQPTRPRPALHHHHSHSWSAPTPAHGRSQSEIVAVTAGPSPSPRASPSPILKKSGEPLKSSLRSRRTSTASTLSVDTTPTPTPTTATTKSEPATPNPKSVHFRAQLAQVKLFSSGQRPSAVSRECSDTDEAEGESSGVDFPAFIYGGGAKGEEEERKRRGLVMSVAGLGEAETKDSDVKLESLELSKDKTFVEGRVKVRNIAFEKWVAVRFTFDGWQTTSEVTARYASSLAPSPSAPEGWDRFAFTIRLSDLMKRIEEKTLVLAVRYSAGGKESWDNRAGRNYTATFGVSAPEEGRGMKVGDLKKRLARVARERVRVGVDEEEEEEEEGEEEEGGGEKALSPLKDGKKSLAARYDFAKSWRASSPTPTGTGHARTWHARRASVPSSVSGGFGVGKPRVGRVSSNSGAAFFGVGVGGRNYESDEEEEGGGNVFGGGKSATRGGSGRRHQRGYGYFEGAGTRKTPVVLPPVDVDLEDEEGLGSVSPSTPPARPTIATTTPTTTTTATTAPSPATPATPTSTTSLAPPGWTGFHRTLSTSGASDESTPSILSPSSSRSSPVSSEEGGEGGEGGQGDERMVGRGNLSAFLSRFCFYTGPDSTTTPTPSTADADVLPKSRSSSSVESFMTSPRSSFSPQLSPSANGTYGRSPSYDDILRSGSATPVARHAGL